VLTPHKQRWAAAISTSSSNAGSHRLVPSLAGRLATTQPGYNGSCQYGDGVSCNAGDDVRGAGGPCAGPAHESCKLEQYAGLVETFFLDGFAPPSWGPCLSWVGTACIGLTCLVQPMARG
jgi:hypothetical protein